MTPIQAAAICQDEQSVALLAANGADSFECYGVRVSPFVGVDPTDSACRMKSLPCGSSADWETRYCSLAYFLE